MNRQNRGDPTTRKDGPWPRRPPPTVATSPSNATWSRRRPSSPPRARSPPSASPRGRSATRRCLRGCSGTRTSRRWSAWPPCCSRSAGGARPLGLRRLGRPGGAPVPRPRGVPNGPSRCTRPRGPGGSRRTWSRPTRSTPPRGRSARCSRRTARTSASAGRPAARPRPLLLAATLLDDGSVPGVWVVLTGREPACGSFAALALALAAPGEGPARLRIGPRSIRLLGGPDDARAAVARWLDPTTRADPGHDRGVIPRPPSRPVPNPRGES